MTANLTRDEILALPAGRELDQQVYVRVFGGQPRRVRALGTADETVEVWTENPYYSDGSHAAGDLRRAPGPPACSTDIAAAMNVLCYARGPALGVRKFVIESRRGGLYSCELNAPPFWAKRHGETISLAICRAALALALAREGA